MPFADLRFGVSSQNKSQRVLFQSGGEVVVDRTIDSVLESKETLDLQVVMDQFFPTNSLPPGDDLAKLETFQNHADEELNALDDERRLAEQSIVKMCERIAEIRLITKKRKEDLRRCKRILSPFRRLPMEVLEQIFLFCRLNGHENEKKLPAPIQLSRVSRFWHQVAVSLPPLWHTLHLHYISDEGLLPSKVNRSESTVPSHFLLELFSSRSNQLPLDLSLKLVKLPVGPRLIGPALVRATTAILPRIRNLKIETGSKSFAHPLFSLPKGQLQILESLTLSVTEPNVRSSPSAISIFGSSPALRRVALDIRPPYLFEVDLPWSQLTHLDMLYGKQPIEDLTWAYLVRLLHNLEDGGFSLIAQASMDPSRRGYPRLNVNSLFPLRKLKKLTIRFVEQIMVREGQLKLLQRLEFPALQHFRFYVLFSLPLFPFTWNQHLHGSLSPQVQDFKSLVLWDVSISTEDLVDLLKCCLSLEQLTLKQTSSWTPSETTHLLDSLSKDNGGLFELAPLLEEMAIWVHIFTTGLASSYIAMVEARKRKHAFKVTLFFDRTRPDVDDGIASFSAIRKAEGNNFAQLTLADPEGRF
ncbi:hypothetical protein GALMADRAFT_258599 [Galerina marginata CBS 339.88]|uniref:F-box domain-containing protein n=1 Tax=Galerina marginata (strain CBS 339.88) TaxID=685588 RepID=A0A067S8K3_GALM3|nr:hypothetical protein GALMADRAFT_258599 [Galerina marginata CBS 339.88]